MCSFGLIRYKTHDLEADIEARDPYPSLGAYTHRWILFSHPKNNRYPNGCEVIILASVSPHAIGATAAPFTDGMSTPNL